MGWLKNAYERYAFFAFLTFLTAVLVDFFLLQHAIVRPSLEDKLRAIVNSRLTNAKKLRSCSLVNPNRGRQPSSPVTVIHITDKLLRGRENKLGQISTTAPASG